MSIQSAIVAALMAVAPLPALADVNWTLQGVTFDDGGTAGGTFVTGNTGQLESYDIETTAGTSMLGSTYDAGTAAIVSESTEDFILELNDGSAALTLGFYQPLTVGNNPDTLVNGTDGYLAPDDSSPSFEENGGQRNVTGGEAVVAPEPMSLAMLTAGLGGLLLTRWQRRSAARR